MAETTETNKTYLDFVEHVRSFLRQEGAVSTEKTSYSRSIVDAVSEKMEGRLTRNSMGNYLNHAARHDNLSGIISAGPAKGYYLNEKAEKFAQQIQKIEDTEVRREDSASKSRLFREEAIYSVLRDWLKAQGYMSKIIADGRNGSKWSNPDIVGIIISSHLEIMDLEITTIEAKINFSNWRQDIFEAISHKRFANRVYFTYPISETLNKIDDEIRRYCDMYRIGIITIDMPDNDFKKLFEAKNKEQLPNISDIDLVEDRIPAPYDFVPPRFQIEFMKQIGVIEKHQLWQFGTND